MIKTYIENIRVRYVEMEYLGNHWPSRGGFSQRDNKIRPSGTCNFTAAANCLDYLEIPIRDEIVRKFPKYRQVEDILTAYSETEPAYREFKKYYPEFDAKTSEIRPRHFSQMVAWVVNQCVGFDVAKWGMRTFAEIVAAVEAKKPVVVSGKFTSFGHFIALKGITPDREFFWVDDSWGDYYTNYRKTDGHNLCYKMLDVKNLCWQNQKTHRTIVFEK